jgi:hypothetical protein
MGRTEASADGENVGVKDDVTGREADAVDQQPVRALADAHLVLNRHGLPLLIELHAGAATLVSRNAAPSNTTRSRQRERERVCVCVCV